MPRVAGMMAEGRTAAVNGRRSLAAASTIAACVLSGLARAASRSDLPDFVEQAPRLAAPTGKVVAVRDERSLQRAVRSCRTGTTIVVAPGTYRLTNTLHFARGVKNVAIRGATGRRGDVVLLGRGMANRDHGDVPHGIMVSKAADVLIADLSVGEVFYHPVTLQGQSGAARVRIRNCRLFDAGEQFVKGTSDGKGGGADGGIVEYCLIEYTQIGPVHNGGYTNGVDIHGGKGWIIRDNVFRNIHVKPGLKYQAVPAVLMWNGAADTVCERNLFIDCDRAIAFGLGPRKGFHDHSGGVIRNNFIAMSKDITNADAGIVVWDSPGTKVLHNTILLNGTYPNAIETRFGGSKDIVIANNLTDCAIVNRNGASAKLTGNLTRAAPGMFVDAASGDLHLSKYAGLAVGKAPPVADCEDDWDRLPRRKGRARDIGADEYGTKPGGSRGRR
jgi:hypothetical protein